MITGGSGFIGSNLIRTLLRDNADLRIVNIDNYDPYYPRAIKESNTSNFPLSPNYKHIDIDISETSVDELIEAIPGRVDAVIHLAGKVGVRPSIENPLSYQHANVIGLQNILDFAKNRKVKQFVFASSSSVYGVNDHFPWNEGEQLMPISPYAMTKQAGEMLGHVYSNLYDMRFIALRFFTVYGPSQRPDLAIHKFTKAILSETPIPLYGDGTTSRDYTYIDDIVSGIIGAIGYTGRPFEIFNLGNNYSIPLNELVSILENVIGKKALIKTMPDQLGDVPKTFADISKAKLLLGYQPKTSLQEGIIKFYNWFLANERLLLGKQLTH